MSYFRKILFCVIFGIFLGFAIDAFSASASVITFVWETPTKRADGSTLLSNEIAGYTLYEDGVQIQWIAGGTTTSTSHDYGGYGQPCFSISTTDTWQQEGAQSTEVCVNVFPAPPGSPALRVSL